MKTIILFFFLSVSSFSQLILYHPDYGNNLIVNGTFDTNVTGWTVINSGIVHYSSDWNSVGRINCLRDSSTNTTGVLTAISITMVSGKTYELTFDYYIPSTNTTCAGVRPRFLGGSNPLLNNQTVTDAWTSVKIIHTATATYTSIRFYQANSTGGISTAASTIGDKFYIDNVVIRERY